MASGTPGGLGHERDRPAGPGVGLEHVDLPVLHGELDVDEAAHLERLGQRAGVALELVDHLVAQRLRGQRAGGVARVHPGLLHVFHHSGDQDFAGTVADGVDVDLDRVLQEAIHQHGTIGGDAALARQRAGGHRLHDAAHAVVVVDDLHGPAAEDIAGAEQDRIADPSGDGQRLRGGRRGAAGRLRNAELVAQRVPALTVLGQVDGGRARPEHQLGRERAGQLQWRLPAEGDDDARHRSRRPPARRRARWPRPRRSAARSRDGPRCRSRSRPSRGCS